MNTKTLEPAQPMADNTGVNYITLITIVETEMKHHHGHASIDHELSQKIAWNIARSIPPNIMLPQARKTTVADVLAFAEKKGLSND